MPKPIDQRKDKVIHVRCSLADHEKIAKSAKAHKQTISIFVYNLLTNFLGGESFTLPKTPLEPENCIQNTESSIDITPSLDDDLPCLINPPPVDDIKGDTQVSFQGEIIPLLDISMRLKRSLLSIRSDLRKGKTLQEIYTEATCNDQTQKTQSKTKKADQRRKPKPRKKQLHKLP